MSRPGVVPDWATATDYAAGASPWSGQPNKSAPSGGKVLSGATPDTDLPAEEYNFVLNNHALWINCLAKATFGTNFLVRDDFSGSAIDTNNWISTNTGGGSGNTIIDDHASGGSGACQQVVTVSGGESSIKTVTMPIGTNDYIYGARIRYVSGGAASYRAGVQSGTTAEEAYFQPQTTTWFWVAGASSGDTGVALGTGYHNLEIRRLKSLGTLEFFIDGASVHSEANSVNIAAAYASADNVQGSATASTWAVDYALFWWDR